MKPEDTRSIQDLKNLVSKGIRPKYVFFWGHTPKIAGQVDQSCLSNWFHAKFEINGIAYATTEHYMMAEKARLFADENIRTQILTSGSPSLAKALGRQVSNFNETTWLQHRFEIVVTGNLAKFTQHQDMGDLLRRTGTKVPRRGQPSRPHLGHRHGQKS